MDGFLSPEEFCHKTFVSHSEVCMPFAMIYDAAYLSFFLHVRVLSIALVSVCVCVCVWVGGWVCMRVRAVWVCVHVAVQVCVSLGVS